MKKCKCTKCHCPNEIKEFGHRYEEENAIAQAEFNKDEDKVESIVEEVCQSCATGQHSGQPKP
jgi:cytochrome c5